MTPCLGPRLREPVQQWLIAQEGGIWVPGEKLGADRKLGVFCMEAEKGLVHSSYVSASGFPSTPLKAHVVQSAIRNRRILALISSLPVLQNL